MKLQASEPSGPQSLQSQIRPWPQKRLWINRLGVVHRQLLSWAIVWLVCDPQQETNRPSTVPLRTACLGRRKKTGQNAPRLQTCQFAKHEKERQYTDKGQKNPECERQIHCCLGDTADAGPTRLERDVQGFHLTPIPMVAHTLKLPRIGKEFWR
jgi:hypothetical protein